MQVDQVSEFEDVLVISVTNLARQLLIDNFRKSLGFLPLSVHIRMALKMTHQHIYVQEDIAAKFLFFKVRHMKRLYLKLNFCKSK